MFSFSAERATLDAAMYQCRSITFRFLTMGEVCPFLKNREPE